jgi:ubiquinone/menaquinone biosynthesis C-methylase UbiE
LNRARYRLYAPIYDLVARPLADGRQRAIERLDLVADDRILILGCGPGVDLEYLPADAAITAIDITPAMVRRTAARADALGMDVDARVGDATDLAFEDDAFDAVLLHLVLSVVPDPGAVLAETDRVLAAGGRVSVFDKFVPPGTDPSLLRRAINPLARVLFSDLTRELDPLVAETSLELHGRESVLGGLYTVTTATRSNEAG